MLVDIARAVRTSEVMRRLFLFLCALVLVACPGSRPSDGEPVAPKTAPAETRTLTIQPGELRVVGDHVVFEPNSRMQRAEYDTYRFEKGAFQAKVGTLTPAAPLRLTVEVIAVKEEHYTPSDPNMPAPLGGFVTTMHACRVVRVEP